LGKSPPPTGSAAAFQITVHTITNVHSTCPWYIKTKLGYNKKQKTKAIKQVNNAIKFDETFYFERWDTKEVVLLSVWKERNKLQHVEVASMELQCPAAKHYPSCTYELKTELFPTGRTGDTKAAESRARANTAEGGQGVDATKPCGEITITVVHVPGHTRWQKLQAEGAGGASVSAADAGESKAPSDSQQSKKAELMKAAAEHKAEKEKPADKPADKPAEAPPASAAAAQPEAKPAEAKPAEPAPVDGEKPSE